VACLTVPWLRGVLALESLSALASALTVLAIIFTWALTELVAHWLRRGAAKRDDAVIASPGGS